MDSVDNYNQMMENCRKSRKSTVKVNFRMFDLAIVSSWFDCRADCSANNRSKDITDLLSFRLSINDHLLNGRPRNTKLDDLEFADVPTSTTSHYTLKLLITMHRQYDNSNHWPVFHILSGIL
ncbi:hypothetical protein EVAR_42090_1 [Eumeta japonica]|uniref:Uncharacterized protein n=1 Tax=Eumeta variegata TaxID=151549 RepID=A0A4C1XEN4_EUMVA|nr:hypothetical protein EVAR_42090_1 [Eumeta japonica]